MQRVQRKFGTFLKRSDDEVDVGNVLHEFEQADRFLTSFITHGKRWRDAWDEVFRAQCNISDSFRAIYRPVSGDDDGQPAASSVPEGPFLKATALNTACSELRTSLLDEVNSIETKLIRPATDAKDSLKPLKKSIKRREDLKLDFERFSSRAENARKKETKSARDESALAKTETDLAHATQAYNDADEQLRRGVPPVLAAIHSMLPLLLATQVMIEHTLAAHLYTVVYEYCQDNNFPVQAPALDAVVSTWDSDFTPLRKEIEASYNMIASGKAVHQPMEMPAEKYGSITGMGLRNNLDKRTKSLQESKPGFSSLPWRGHAAQNDEAETPPEKPARPGMGTPTYSTNEDEEDPPPQPPRPITGAPSPSKPRIPSSRLSPAISSPNMSNVASLRPTGSPYAAANAVVDSPHGSPWGGSSTPAKASSGPDYFSLAAKASPPSSAASVAAAKKKPPPPPPSKRIPSAQAQYVTAIYDYAGQAATDLSFEEGDKIRIIKKTGSTNDWWEGELRGVTGSFPANYVQV